MSTEAGTADYFNTNKVIREERQRSPGGAVNFAQKIRLALTKSSISQSNQQLETKNITGLNYQLSTQQIQDNLPTVFEQANVGIAFIATSGQFLRVNPYLCDLLQYPESAMYSFTISDITHAEDLAVAWQYLDRVLSDRQPHQPIEQRYRRRDGQWQWVNITLSLVRDAQNIPLYLIATIQDIQPYKRAEAKLKQRIKLETATAQISRKLINQTLSQIDYEEILAMIGNAIGCDLAYLARFDSDGQNYINYWSALHPDNTQLQPKQILAMTKFAWWQAQLCNHQNIIIANVANLPTTAQAEQNLLQSLNVCSTLAIPIYTPSGQLWGTLGCHNIKENYRDWSKEDAQQLRILGEIIQINYQYQISQTRLQASENLSSKFFQNSVDGIFVVDLLSDGQLVYKDVNPAYAKLIGTTDQNIRGKTTSEILPSPIAQLIESKYRLCLATKNTLEFMLTPKLLGETRNWHIYLVPIEDDSGQSFSIQGVIKDITEEQQALEKQTRYSRLLKSITFKIRQSLDIQEILQTTITELQTTFNADRVLLLQFLPDGTGKVIKESVKAGFPPILQKVITDEYCRDILPEKYSESYAYICADTDNAQLSPCHREFLQRYRIKANLVLPISRYLPIKNSSTTAGIEKYTHQQSNIWGLLCVQQCSRSRQWNQDEIELLQHLAGQLTIAISQSELLESEINQRQELARSNSELEQFAYIASHDLQAPLQTVSNYVQLFQRRYQGQIDDKGEKFISYILDGVYRMRTQINDLLEYSRVGRQRSTFRTTDCNLVVEQAIANLRSEIEKQRALVTYCHSLPTLIADSSQLVVLFQNLISNAIKYRTAADPTIKINACRRGDNWQFSVSDNGIGIEPKYQQRIFQIFQRLHTQEEYPGNGIGLAICQKIVERHGGEIKVDSQLNLGSTFYFTIPA